MNKLIDNDKTFSKENNVAFEPPEQVIKEFIKKTSGAKWERFWLAPFPTLKKALKASSELKTYLPPEYEIEILLGVDNKKWHLTLLRINQCFLHIKDAKTRAKEIEEDLGATAEICYDDNQKGYFIKLTKGNMEHIFYVKSSVHSRLDITNSNKEGKNE